MHKIGILPIILFIEIIISGCGTRAEKKESLPFPVVEPPVLITDTEKKLDYLSEHCWDEFFALSPSEKKDSNLINGISLAEVRNNYVNYVQILSSVSHSQAKKSISGFYTKVAETERKDSLSNTFETMVEFTETYLYDPNSPFRDEDIYAVFAQKMSSSEFLRNEEREKYRIIAQKCALNSVGTPAADFLFSDEKGRNYSLHKIEAEFTILFFSNPDCVACESVISNLNSNDKLTQLVKAERIKVLNIYIDEDLTAWYKYMPIYPKTWINGYDPNLSVKNDELYNIRAIPSLYLLDDGKNVILKDATLEKIYNFIQNIK